MIKGLRVLAVCPARGGSKGIPLKNIRPIAGIPMVAHVGRITAQVPEVDRAVVSTDHEGIANIAEGAGLAAPFRRPPELSGDRVSDHPVLVHALQQMERIDSMQYDIVVMLQPTSPLRTPEHVSRSIQLLVEGAWDAVWTVSKTESKGHPLKQLNVSSSGELSFYDPRGESIIARQQLEPVYHRNGISYAITRECLLDQGTIMGKRTRALVLDGELISIDTEWDCRLVEFLIAESSS